MPSDPSVVVKSFLASGSLPLSRSVTQVQSMLSRADYNACDLAEHLRMDPTLAARVMSVANSAFFSRQPCATIDDAVNRLGTVQLTRIFAQVLASAAMINPLRAYGLQADAMWRYSVYAAVGAEMAAGRQGEDRSSAYMVGLLHLVGMLVVQGIWAQKGATQKLQLAGFEREWSADEKKLCGFDHPTLGAELLRQLSFPASVVTTIGQQYQFPSSTAGGALYVGRLTRPFPTGALTADPDRTILNDFNLGSESELGAFLTDVREEAQSLMRAA
jgi:HD-like signal output (HDOD) protein